MRGESSRSSLEVPGAPAAQAPFEPFVFVVLRSPPAPSQACEEALLVGIGVRGVVSGVGVGVSVAVAFQLALFPSTVPPEPASTLEPAPAPEVERVPVQGPAGQMGLFDAQVGRLRAALHAVDLADLPSAMSLLEGLAPEFDPVVPLMKQRLAEIHSKLERVRTLPVPARVAAHLERGRALAAEGDPWSNLGRALIAKAAADIGAAEGRLAARLFMEARELRRAKSALLGIPGPSNAANLFALGDVESGLGDRHAARRHYRDALILDPFDAALDLVADEEVGGLPYLAEFEVEVDGDPRAWCAPVGIVAGVLPRTRELTGELPMPTHAPADRLAALARAREFVDALVRAEAPDVQRSREAWVETRRCMKRASAPLFAWYLARQTGAR